jgi:hypothetical protein
MTVGRWRGLTDEDDSAFWDCVPILIASAYDCTIHITGVGLSVSVGSSHTSDNRYLMKIEYFSAEPDGVIVIEHYDHVKVPAPDVPGRRVSSRRTGRPGSSADTCSSSTGCILAAGHIGGCRQNRAFIE